MARGPRRLRNLNLEEPDVEPEQEEFENLAENENDGPPAGVDNLLAHMPHQPRSPIKIIWPNGEVRQVLGDFGVSNLLDLQGGKIIVGTDENGVPNERSASILGQHLGDLAESSTFAPLHIPRWDNDLFKTHKEQIIKDVEAKFDFPRQTIQLTRDWILRTVNNRWRAYKSKLKKQHFNREVRSLDEIIRGKPQTVNEHQWRSLVGLWCQETHKKLCETNTRTAKEQKNPHTAGRKSHARLKKEMEDQRQGKVHRLELWDAAHKKKNGRYSTNKVKTVMDTSLEELQKRKEKKNGNLSAQDFNEVFNEVVAKQLKVRGYYDDKYWSQIKVSQGTFVTQSEEERRYQEKVNAMENKMQSMSSVMKQWVAFMARKFPEEDCINEMEATINDPVGHNETEGDMDHDCSDHHIHDNYGDDDTDNSHEDHSPSNHVQQPHVQKNDFIQSSLSCEQTIEKEARKESSAQAYKGDVGINLPYDNTLTNMRSRRTKAQGQNQSESGQKEVYLFSLRNKGKIMAKGKLVSTDSKRIIGGCMLGKEFVAVHVDGLENIASGNKGDEELPRPTKDIHTVIDAIGYVIAWPRSLVKIPKSSTKSFNNLHDGRMQINDGKST